MISSVSDLWVGEVLRSTKEHFDIKITAIGSRFTKYLNLDTGERVVALTGDFNSQLRNNGFRK